MTAGIDQSHVIVAFLAETYTEKVRSSRDNDICKLEFTDALNRKSNVIVGVPMEPRTLNPSTWLGSAALWVASCTRRILPLVLPQNQPEF